MFYDAKISINKLKSNCLTEAMKTQFHGGFIMKVFKILAITNNYPLGKSFKYIESKGHIIVFQNKEDAENFAEDIKRKTLHMTYKIEDTEINLSEFLREWSQHEFLNMESIFYKSKQGNERIKYIKRID